MADNTIVNKNDTKRQHATEQLSLIVVNSELRGYR
jgi:hypothetical protein